MNQSKNSTPKIAIPKTADGCSPTITSSFGAGISIANLLGVDHFPKGGGTNNQEKKMCDKIIKLVSLNRPERFEQQNRVYSVKGISPTLNSVMGNGGNNIPLFLIVKEI